MIIIAVETDLAVVFANEHFCLENDSFRGFGIDGLIRYETYSSVVAYELFEKCRIVDNRWGYAFGRLWFAFGCCDRAEGVSYLLVVVCGWGRRGNNLFASPILMSGDGFAAGRLPFGFRVGPVSGGRNMFWLDGLGVAIWSLGLVWGEEVEG